MIWSNLYHVSVIFKLNYLRNTFKTYQVLLIYEQYLLVCFLYVSPFFPVVLEWDCFSWQSLSIQLQFS